MYADTDAIHAYGLANADLGTDIRNAAALLEAVPVGAVTDAFGPVGTRFAAALAGAIDQLTQQASRLAGDVDDGGATSITAARAYADTDIRAQAQVGRVGT